MEGKKNWKILVWVAMVLCMAMPNRVEASEENSYIIPILETVWVEENEQQGSRMGVPQSSIGSGKTISFLDSSGSMFYVLGGTTVNFTVSSTVNKVRSFCGPNVYLSEREIKGEIQKFITVHLDPQGIVLYMDILGHLSDMKEKEEKDNRQSLAKRWEVAFGKRKKTCRA